MSGPLGLSADELIRQDRWLRELVRGLVGESQVDDVVQETWAMALRRSESVERPGAWLTVVARNLARRARRSMGRRLRREEQAAQPESVPSTEETLELLELQEHVLRAVRELREPYQETLLLRYTHGLSVADVAKRTRVTEAAARQRLKRGLDEVRSELGESYREDWRALPALSMWLVPGAVEMKKSMSLVVVGLVIAGMGGVAAWGLLPDGDGGSRGAPVVEAVGTPKGQESAGIQGEAALEAEARTPLLDRQVAAGQSSSPAVWTGRVLDASGRGLVGLGLGLVASGVTPIPSGGLERPAAEFESGADGSFTFTTEFESCTVVPGAAWVPIAATEFAAGEEGRLALAPSIEMGGTVVDASGLPLEGVEVAVVKMQLSDFGGVLMGLKMSTWEPALSDRSGAFLLADLPASHGSLQFQKGGYLTQRIKVGDADARHHTVTLERDMTALLVTGTVSSPDGEYLEGVRVGLGEHSTRTDARGVYRLMIPSDRAPEEQDDLWAAMAPWQTSVTQNIGALLLAAADRVLEVDVRFQDKSLSINGRVLDHEGQPVVGLAVYPWHLPEVTDGLSAEDLAVPEGREPLEVGPGVLSWAKTGTDGRFQLDGLGDDEYKLRLFERKRLAVWTSAPILAGEQGVELVLPEDFVRPKLEGRIVDLTGRGVPDVKVLPMALGYFSRYIAFVKGIEPSVTDADGRFAFTAISGRDLALSLSGETIMPTLEFIADGSKVTEVELQVEALCHFRVVLTSGADKALSVQALDAAQQELQIGTLGGERSELSSMAPIQDGKTRVLSVGQSVTTLVLCGAGKSELGRRSVTLAPGSVVEVVW